MKDSTFLTHVRLKNYRSTAACDVKLGSGVMTASSVRSPPAAAADRLYLVNVSGIPEFRAAYESFSHMGIYNLSPDRIRDLQSPATGEDACESTLHYSLFLRSAIRFPSLASSPP